MMSYKKLVPELQNYIDFVRSGEREVAEEQIYYVIMLKNVSY